MTRLRLAGAVAGAMLIAGISLTGRFSVAAEAVGSETKLPLPRFVSLRSDEVNLRTGPGTNYPVDWVFVRRELPVEVIAEFDMWRKVRDWQGTVGWVHHSMLDGRRTILITGSDRTILVEPADTAPGTARLAPGVIGRLLECEGTWCRIEAKGYRGWLKREEFWGTYPDETVR